MMDILVTDGLPRGMVTNAMISDDLGQIIWSRRRSLGYTQEDLEERSGISQSRLSDIESGKTREPTDRTLEALADALDLSLDILKQAAGKLIIKEGVPIQDWGRVPADAPRWVESQQKGATVDVPRAWVGSRKPDELFVVEASGDCLMRAGIVTGSKVLCEIANGCEPRNGQIVAVRIGDERSLKRWHRDGRDITLTDGDGTVVARLTTDDDIEVVGLFIAAWIRDEQ